MFADQNGHSGLRIAHVKVVQTLVGDEGMCPICQDSFRPPPELDQNEKALVNALQQVFPHFSNVPVCTVHTGTSTGFHPVHLLCLLEYWFRDYTRQNQEQQNHGQQPNILRHQYKCPSCAAHTPFVPSQPDPNPDINPDPNPGPYPTLLVVPRIEFCHKQMFDIPSQMRQLLTDETPDQPDREMQPDQEMQPDERQLERNANQIQELQQQRAAELRELQNRHDTEIQQRQAEIQRMTHQNEETIKSIFADSQEHIQHEKDRLNRIYEEEKGKLDRQYIDQFNQEVTQEKTSLQRQYDAAVEQMKQENIQSALREKENIQREKETIQRERGAFQRERDAVQRDKERDRKYYSGLEEKLKLLNILSDTPGTSSDTPGTSSVSYTHLTLPTILLV